MKQNSQPVLLIDRLHALFIMFLCAGFLFYKYIMQIYPSTITSDLMREFGLSATSLGNLAATFYYSYMLAQLFVGPILDRYSTRLLTSAAIALCGVSMIMFADTHSLWVAQLARILMGVGVSFATIVYLKLAALWFHPRYYAMLSGFLPTAAMAGAFFGQAPLTMAINCFGWRLALNWVGILGVVLAVLFFIVVRDKNEDKVSDQHLSWQDIGLVLRNKQNWLLTLYIGLAFTPVAVFGSLWGNPFIQAAYSVDKTTAATLVSLVFVGLAVGGPVIGVLSERVLNRVRLLAYCTILAAIIFALVLYYPSLPLSVLGLILFVFGFLLGSVSIVYTIGKENNSAHLIATAITMINTSDGVLTGITEPGIGKLLDLSWDGTLVNGIHHFSLAAYRYSLSILFIYLLISIVLLWWLKDQRAADLGGN